jgi:hypothetical protein
MSDEAPTFSLAHVDESGKPCVRDQGYTVLVRETAGVAYGNPAAEMVSKLMCNRCGTVVDAPEVLHPARLLGYRAP